MANDIKQFGELRRRVEQAVVAHARTLVPHAGGFSFGATDIDPKYFVIFVTTPTDLDRDRLASDTSLVGQFQKILRTEGYPSLAVPEVGFEFESQETVDRDYGGNWWHRVK